MTNNLLKIFPILILQFMSCSKQPTSPETGSLTGAVLLEGQTNHSNITVALYELAELDTAIVGYNQRFPNVAFPISQVTEFDHRFAEVVAETKTKADGTFKIEGIEEGTYNLVAKKEGFGWKYIYNIPINSGANTVMNQVRNNPMNRLANNGQLGQLKGQLKIKNAKFKVTDNSSLITHPFSLFTFNLASLTLNLAPQTLNFGLCTSNNSITLYPVTEVSGTLTENTTWQLDRHFIVTEGITVPQGISLVIEPVAVVRFDGYYKLKIEGNLLCQGEPENMVMFTLLDSKPRGITNIQRGKHLTGFTSNQNQPMPGDRNRLEFNGVDSTSCIEYTKVSYSTSGIMCKKASPKIERTCIKESAEAGILVANCFTQNV